MDRYFGQHAQSVCHAVGDETAAYIVGTRRAFEDLRQVAAQVAGLLVLAGAGSPSAGPHHPMLAAAEELLREAAETVRLARVPEGARRHHEYLLASAAALERALRAAKRGVAIDPVLVLLRAAYKKLESASRELPGFAMVAFEQGCCGVARAHGGVRVGCVAGA
ncbi:MAG: hypothetical protein JO099_03270 [Acidobacteriia bacterium]|nr:hypothetical protein [Terriglobia bacterium]